MQAPTYKHATGKKKSLWGNFYEAIEEEETGRWRICFICSPISCYHLIRPEFFKNVDPVLNVNKNTKQWQASNPLLLLFFKLEQEYVYHLLTSVVAAAQLDWPTGGTPCWRAADYKERLLLNLLHAQACLIERHQYFCCCRPRRRPRPKVLAFQGPANYFHPVIQ